MSCGGAPRNAAVSPRPRAMPATGHFGWDWLSGGRRWRIFCGPSPLYRRRLPGRVEWGRLAPRRQSELSTAGDFDLTLSQAMDLQANRLGKQWTLQNNSPGCGRNGSRGRVQVCKTEATVLSLLVG